MGKRKRKEDTKSNPVEDGPNPAGDHIPTASDNNSEEPKTHLQTLIEVKDDFDKLKELWRARKTENVDYEFVLTRASPGQLSDLWSSWYLWIAEDALALVGLPTESEGPDTEKKALALSRISVLIPLAKWTVQLPIWKSVPEPIPDHLRQSCHLLHLILASPTLASSEEPFKNAISLLCETWYSQKLDGWEELIPNAMTFLLKRSLSDHGTKADVKRVWNLHEVLHEYNFSEGLVSPIQDLLLQTIQSPTFLRCVEGIRFLVFLFGLNPSFIERLFEAIKSKLPGATKAIASAYGEILYKAWRASAGSFQSNLEECCLQKLMYHSVLSNRALKKQFAIFEPIFSILDHFHRAKNDRPCQAMIKRLWEPILWRHLKVANHMARMSSAEMLFNAFPIENPDDEVEVRNRELEGQYQIMTKLLLDDNPDVRVVAINGCFSVLKELWLIIPSNRINDIIKIVVRDLAFDATSPKVRLASIKGLTRLLGNVRTHIYLKAVLPKVSLCLHDVNDGVRSAMVEMLHVTKGIKAIRYWDICPVDQILARLDLDANFSINSKIVKLISNSFFPLNDDLDEAVKIERAIYLVKENRDAARKFYRLFEKRLDLHQIVKFMLAVLIHLKRFVKSEMENSVDNISLAEESQDETEDNNLPGMRAHHDESSSDKENSRNLSSSVNNSQSKNATSANSSSTSSNSLRAGKRKRKLYTNNSSKSQEEIITNDDAAENASLEGSQQTTTNDVNNTTIDRQLEDSNVVSGLLDIVCIFWVCRSAELSQTENTEYRTLLEKKSIRILTGLFKYYRSSDVIGPVLYICSFLPHASVSTVAGFCLSRLRTLEIPDDWDLERDDPMTKLDLISVYTDPLCNWGRGDDLLEMAVDWIKKDLQSYSDKEDSSSPSSPSCKRTRRAVRFAEPVTRVVPRPKLSLILTQYILKHAVNRPILLKRNRLQMEELMNVLRDYLPIIKAEMNSGSVSKESESKYLIAWELHHKLNVLLNKASEDAFKIIEDSIEWVSDEILQQSGDGDDATKLPLTSLQEKLVTSLMMVCCNMVALDFCDINLIGHIAELSKRAAERDSWISTLSLCSQITKEITGWTVSHILDSEKHVIFKKVLPELINGILTGLKELEIADSDRNEDQVTELNRGLKEIRSQFLYIVEAHRTKVSKVDEDAANELIEMITSAILSIFSKQISKSGTLKLPSSTPPATSSQDLSPIVACLLSILNAKSVIIYGVLEDIIALLIRNEMQSLNETATLVRFSKIVALNSGGPKVPKVVLKELIDALDKNITALEAKTITNDLKSSDDVDVSTNNDALGCSELIKNCRESLTSIQEVIRT